MWRRTAIPVIAVSFLLAIAPNLLAQQTESKRKVTSQVLPAYPKAARSMGLKGMVRVDVIVASNGSVKSVEIKGGHPVLAEAAADAVRKWKWAPASHETTEPVIVRFDPGEQ